MWELLLIFLFLNVPPQFLHAFDNKADCVRERNRIGFEMANAYPYEHDFDVVCQLKQAVI